MTGGGGGASAAGGGVWGTSAGLVGELPNQGGNLTLNQRVDSIIAQSYMSTRDRGDDGWPPPLESVRRLLSRLGCRNPSYNLISIINDRLREATNPNTTVKVFTNMRTWANYTSDD